MARAGIGIDQQGGAIAQRAANGGDDGFGAAGPFIGIAAAFGGDAEFEGVKTMRIAQGQKAGRFIGGCDVALHGAGIGAQLARAAADERGDGLARRLAAMVPHCRIEPAKRAVEIGAGEFMLVFGDFAEQIVEIIG